MKKNFSFPFNAGFFWIIFGMVATCALGAKENRTFNVTPHSVSEKIEIDGILDEKVWRNTPLKTPMITFSPVYGQPLGEDTLVWAAYDRDHLYFAFRCMDARTDRIKTSITRRDHFGGDDWIGVVIDSINQRQSSFEFYANPSGIQTDGMTSAVNSFRLNTAVDFVWESAGRITDSGYDLEFAIPLESLRFKGGERVVMGISVMRYINRLGRMGSWPEIPAGQTQFNAMAVIEYTGIHSGLSAEILPSFTTGRHRDRSTLHSWSEAEWSHRPGLSVKYGITSSITAEATINPDFSQVESDAFQVTVNQRYPLFFDEKRPFFMEGTDVLDFGIVPSGMMYSAVHTRNIVDPSLAFKLSGSAGALSFVALGAGDEAPDPGGILKGNSFWGVARAKASIGSDNALGFLYSGRSRDGAANNVIGADLQYRFFGNLRLSASWLHSRTRPGRGMAEKGGNALNAVLQFMNPKLETWAAFELYDREFQMDSAFLVRGRISRWQYYLGPILIPEREGSLGWIQSIQPYFQYVGLHDLESGIDDSSGVVGTVFFFRQTDYMNLAYHDEREGWQGERFTLRYFSSSAGFQLSRRFSFRAAFRSGDQLYYGPGEPFTGPGRRIRFGCTILPTGHSLISLDWENSRLRRSGDPDPVYSVNIWNVRTTYQFTRHFFLRAILRYDDYREQLLTDFLASFTLIPGTVVHLGYGGLYEPLPPGASHPVDDPLRMIYRKSSLFFKVSYLWRL